MKKEKWAKRIQMIVAAGIAGFLVVETMASSEKAYFLVEVLMLFSILFVSYRYGASVGAVAGTLWGITLTLWEKDLGMLGILTMMGTMAGLFSRLGRVASCVAYLTGAVGVGVLYAPETIMDSFPTVVCSLLLFLILPRQLFQTQVEQIPEEIQKQDAEGLIGMRVQTIADCYRELARAFENHGTTIEDEMCLEDGQWRSRYMESRMMMEEQYSHLATVMNEFRQELQETEDVTSQVKEKLKGALKANHIDAKRIVLVEGEDKKREAVLTLCTENGTCVTSKKISEMMGDALSYKWRPAEGCRPVVTGQLTVLRLEEEPSYMMLHGAARMTKDSEEISGDNFSFMMLPRGKVLMALCDGMGSGEKACEESRQAIELTEKMSEAGFPPEMILRMVHNAMMMQEEELHPMAMDMALIDLYTGICDCTKSGSAVTLIKSKDSVEIIRSESLPVGYLPEIHPQQNVRKLYDGDFIIMVTDGVVEAFEGDDKEEELAHFCARMKSSSPKDLANKLLLYALAQRQGEARDDMTVLVAGIWKK